MLRLAAEPNRWISVTAPLSACSAFSPGLIQQEARDGAVYDLQHRRHQLGLRGQQQAQRDGQREHPLAHRHVRDDAVHQVRRLGHSPGPARRAKASVLAAEGKQLVVPAVAAAQPQQAVGQDAAQQDAALQEASTTSFMNCGRSAPTAA